MSPIMLWSEKTEGDVKANDNARPVVGNDVNELFVNAPI
jgi:hypothetical protein